MFPRPADDGARGDDATHRRMVLQVASLGWFWSSRPADDEAELISARRAYTKSSETSTMAAAASASPRPDDIE